LNSTSEVWLLYDINYYLTKWRSPDTAIHLVIFTMTTTGRMCPDLVWWGGGAWNNVSQQPTLW